MNAYLSAVNTPFGMLVDPDRIEIYRWEENRLSGPIYSAETASIFRYYSEYYEKFKSAGVGVDRLLVYVKAWLRDLSYRWKSGESVR
jgi:hypothetical protein